MGIKQYIPGTAEHIQKYHAKYLHRKARGADLLLMVEWRDGQITELPVNYDPESGNMKAKNGLTFALAGEGLEPKTYCGVPVLRTHAAIPCPIDTTTAIAADLDESGNYAVVTDDDKVVQLSEGVALNEDGTYDPNGTPEEDEQVERVYQMRPPSGTTGWVFSLSNAVQRAPNPISTEELKRQEERGKAANRDASEFLKYLLIGAGLTFIVIVGVLGVQWLFSELSIAALPLLAGKRGILADSPSNSHTDNVSDGDGDAIVLTPGWRDDV